MKRITIFCDGTWNTPDKMKDGKYCQTNVVKMANALVPVTSGGIQQILYYDTGIGSEGGVLKRIYDGATGSGISENILQAYRYLIKNYEPGDELFLFGFSRGAYTVRSLAGLIRNSGILRFEYLDKMQRAYDIYKSRKAQYQPREIEATLFRKTFAVEEHTQIKFIGVWDTVGALGNPLFLKRLSRKRNQFHDTELSSRISYAYHALAIDEKRKNFQATLWHQQSGAQNQVLEQQWFTGVHSDVGGGYPPKQSGLSDIALKWLIEKAKNCQLEFEDVKAEPDALPIIHKSYRGFYKLIRAYHRPIGISGPGNGNTNESLHSSVIERYQKDLNYRPKNLVEYFNRNSDSLA